MFDLFQPTHLLFVLLVALVVFGPKRLAEVSRSLGRAIQSLQEYREGFEDELLNSTAVEEEAEKGILPGRKDSRSCSRA